MSGVCFEMSNAACYVHEKFGIILLMGVQAQYSHLICSVRILFFYTRQYRIGRIHELYKNMVTIDVHVAACLQVAKWVILRFRWGIDQLAHSPA